MRALVFGGRFYADRKHVYRVLDEVHGRYGITELIHGACPYGGADILAEDWAKDREVDYRGVPAKFKKLGKPAGPRRNERMLTEFGDIHIAVAFPGDRGTNHMMSLVIRAGIHNIDHRSSVPSEDSNQ